MADGLDECVEFGRRPSSCPPAASPTPAGAGAAGLLHGREDEAVVLLHRYVLLGLCMRRGNVALWNALGAQQQSVK